MRKHNILQFNGQLKRHLSGIKLIRRTTLVIHQYGATLLMIIYR